jgi:four helix bundle protein
MAYGLPHMTQPAKTFRDLIVWQKAHEFVLGVYQYTGHYPKCELFCLTSQFRRAAISIAANVAEGFKKRSEAEKLRFVGIAQSSLEECRYYLILSEDLNYGATSQLTASLADVSRLLGAYAEAINRSNKR